MSENQTNDELVGQILIELGTLLRMKIDAYINEHYQGNGYRFLNDHIVFPSEYDSESYSVVDELMEKSNRLNRNLSTSNDVCVTEVHLDDDGDLIFELVWYDYGIDDEARVEINICFTLKQNLVEISDSYKNKLLSIPNQKLEIILGDLKLDFYR